MHFTLLDIGQSSGQASSPLSTRDQKVFWTWTTGTRKTLDSAALLSGWCGRTEGQLLPAHKLVRRKGPRGHEDVRPDPEVPGKPWTHHIRSPSWFHVGVKTDTAPVSIFLWLFQTVISLLTDWLFGSHGLSSALTSSTHYWGRIDSLFTTNYLHRMSLPSVGLIRISSLLCAKVDGTHGSWKWNPFWRPQKGSLAFLDLGLEDSDWDSTQCIRHWHFHDLLGVRVFYILFYLVWFSYYFLVCVVCVGYWLCRLSGGKKWPPKTSPNLLVRLALNNLESRCTRIAWPCSSLVPSLKGILTEGVGANLGKNRHHWFEFNQLLKYFLTESLVCIKPSYNISICFS